MPSAPPMSPVTTSYFTCWAEFDCCAGSPPETFGTILLRMAELLGMDPELRRLIALMQQSRMGIYINRGRATAPSGEKTVVLEDLGTGEVLPVHSPTGYFGQPEELWYVRVLPPPGGSCEAHVAFTTPYVLLSPVSGWVAWLQRTFRDPDAPAGDYERYMKLGPSHDYWLEFIFEAYARHTNEAIFLMGVPDIAESRPHSKANAHLWDSEG